MPKGQQLVNLQISVSPESVVESLVDGMTHEQTIGLMLAMDGQMSDMDASIMLLDGLLGSLRDEVKVGDSVEEVLPRFDSLRKEMITLLKAGID